MTYSNLTMSFSGVTFNSDVRDADGILWRARIPAGWYAAPVELELMKATGQHGETPVSDLYAARGLVLRGMAQAPSDAARDLATDRLRVMPRRGELSPFVVNETVPKQVLARGGATKRIEPPVGGVVLFELDLVCPDPFKRALAATPYALAAGATVDVTNAGDEAAYVTIETATPGTVWVRQDDSGAVMRSRNSVSAGTVFEAQARSVTPRVAMVAPSEWLAVPAESTVQVTNLGSADLTLSVYDTFS